MPLNIVLYTGTGRCTSFAIQTVNAISYRYPSLFDFSYYRLGNHHLARCKKTGVVINSSCKMGAFVLEEGEDMATHSTNPNGIYTWTFLGPDTSRYRTERPKKKKNRRQVCFSFLIYLPNYL